MASRPGFVPMDFEYDNRDGPLPDSSPFPRADPTKRYGFGHEPQKSPFRPTSLFDSTVKLPQTPSKLPPAWREQPDTDFSADNQSSPEQADTEDTPDMPRISREIGKNITVERGKSPAKKSPSRRDSLFGTLGDLASNMGNVFVIGPTQFVSRDRYGRPLQRKSRKRLRKEFDQDNQVYRRNEDFSDMDDSRPSSREGRSKSDQPPVKEMGTIPAVLSFIHQHPDLPHVLGYYANLLLNMVLMGLFCWGIWAIWQAFGHEIDVEVQKKVAELMRENLDCASRYTENRCGPDSETPPALRGQCAEWLDCMNRDPKAIGRTSISAGTFAVIINSFMEKLSWKTITTFAFLSLALISIPKLLFGALIRQNAPHYPPPPQYPSSQYMQSPYQPTPQHQQFYTPQHQRVGAPGDFDMSPSKRGRDSPSKRLAYL